MAEMRHSNVMPLYCSFVHKEQLWMVMPYVSGGSIYNIILNQHSEVGPAETPLLQSFRAYLALLSAELPTTKTETSAGLPACCKAYRCADHTGVS